MKSLTAKAAILFCLAISLPGCVTTRVVAIPADREVRFLPEGQTFTAPKGGMWLVPPERMREILYHLEGK
jgi:hypothetical protein